MPTMTSIWLHSENTINFPLSRVATSRATGHRVSAGFPRPPLRAKPLPAVATHLKTLCLGGSPVNTFSCLVAALPGLGAELLFHSYLSGTLRPTATEPLSRSRSIIASDSWFSHSKCA